MKMLGLERRREKHLVLGLKASCPRAFEVLRERTEAPLRRWAEALLGDSAHADEAVADVYIQVWKSIDRFDLTRGKLWPWILSIARTRAVDRQRAEKRWRTVADTTSEEPPAEGPADPRETVLAYERRAWLHEALARLARPRREALVLAELHGLSHSEVARRLRLPVGTVKSRIRRARAELRDSLVRLERRGQPRRLLRSSVIPAPIAEGVRGP